MSDEADTTTATIGGEIVTVPAVINFAGVKRLWPAVQAMGAAANAVDVIATSCAIVAVALRKTRPELDAAEIEGRLVAGETDSIVAAASWIVDRSGFFKPAEPAAAEG